MGLWNNLINRQVSLVRVVLAIGLVIAGVAAGYGFSVARAQSGDTTIYACVNKWNGTTRIVDEGDNCSRSENAESWGKQGPQGPAGLNGINGTNGQDGIAGYEVITEARAITSVDDFDLTLECTGDRVPLAGGFSVASFNGSTVTALSSSPLFTTASQDIPVGWIYYVTQGTSSTIFGEAKLWVTCALLPT